MHTLVNFKFVRLSLDVRIMVQGMALTSFVRKIKLNPQFFEEVCCGCVVVLRILTILVIVEAREGHREGLKVLSVSGHSNDSRFMA